MTTTGSAATATVAGRDERVGRVAVSGATRNFFKVGHTTIHRIARDRPDVRIRLGVPHVDGARGACDGIDVEFVEWDRSRPEGLVDVLRGTDALLMVPPIDGRVEVAGMYVRTAVEVGVSYICCLGVQYERDDVVLSRDAAEVEGMLERSGIDYSMLRLPIFPENLLYQVPSISREGVLRYPCGPDSPLPYVTCDDLGDVCARALTGDGPRHWPDTRWTAREATSCAKIAQALSAATGRQVRFEQQDPEEFVAGLVAYGMRERAARGVLQLWQLADSGQDLEPTGVFEEVLGRRPTTVEEWIGEHACCFRGEPCSHPKPPADHMH